MKKQIQKFTINVSGMSCNNCAIGLENHLKKNGINHVSVNFSTGEANFSLSNDQNINDVEKIIQKIGYSTTFTYEENNRYSKTEKYFYTSLFFTIPLFLLMFFAENKFFSNPLLQFSLCLPVYIIGVLYFGKSALKSLKSGVPNMDVLIFMGASAAFFYSIYGSFFIENNDLVMNFLFYETSSTIITLVLLGNVLENKSVKKTTSSIAELTKLQNSLAKKYENGKVIKTKYEDLEINDIILVNSGDKIPIDGVIISGEAYIDEAMITGENTIIFKNIGQEVIGGTIINNGSIKIKISKNKDETFLAQIIQLVKDAQNNKPQIQKIGDKVSSIFVPFVVVISIITYLVCYYFLNIEMQEALLRSIAVLVISCPCAMGLATPTAVMVGVGLAAKNGILIKGGNTIESLAKAQNIVFDKTGTLTTGEFSVTNFNIINGNKKEISNIIFNIESHSNHPIAKSLCKYFDKNNKLINVTNIIEKKGISISAKVDNIKYEIGSSKINHSELNNDIYVLKDNILIATLDIKDTIKENCKSIISSLHSEGYSTTILSGDSKEKCNEIALEIGINSILGEQLPKDKIKYIEKLIMNNTTIMVGDGINDAPALAKSCVGISFSNATDIAIKSSDVILLNNSKLDQLLKTIQISRHTLLAIKQNLFWAFSYNILAIPMAIMGLINPMWAAFFMAFSDIMVIGNSLRLRYKNIF